MRKILVLLALIFLASIACAQENQSSQHDVTVYLFWSIGCPHCAKEKPMLEQMEKDYPWLKVNYLEVSENVDNARLYSQMAEACNQKPLGVPATFINDGVTIGYNDAIGLEIKDKIMECRVKGCIDPITKLTVKINETNITQRVNQTCDKSEIIRLPGNWTIDSSQMSLPMFTLVIAGLDSFNPCAFFVLFVLLSLLINAQKRRIMLLIGGIFVFFSAFIYFVFMTAWLNLFLIVGQVKIITLIAGLIAIVISAINIKEYFQFKQGISLSIPDAAKPKLYSRMRNIVKASELPSMIIETVILAIAANTYELLCTAGFPMVYTRVLTLKNLTTLDYYGYLAFYNIIYVIPLAVIVLMFTITLGSRKLQEDEGRVLKLLSGLMMVMLGIILVFAPELLNNVIAAGGILVFAVGATAIIALIERTRKKKKKAK